MSEKNVNDLPGIRWWMKKRSSHYFRNAVTFLIVSCMMVFLFWTGKENINSIQEVVPLIVLLLFFLLFTGYQFVLWLHSLHWNISHYWFGTIVDTYCIRNRKRKIRSYRIIANVNGKTMEGICLLRTFNRANKGDRVLLFTLEGEKIFCVHPY